MQLDLELFWVFPSVVSLELELLWSRSELLFGKDFVLNLSQVLQIRAGREAADGEFGSITKCRSQWIFTEREEKFSNKMCEEDCKPLGFLLGLPFMLLAFPFTLVGIVLWIITLVTICPPSLVSLLLLFLSPCYINPSSYHIKFLGKLVLRIYFAWAVPSFIFNVSFGERSVEVCCHSGYEKRTSDCKAFYTYPSSSATVGWDCETLRIRGTDW